MKKIEAIIKPFKLDEVKEALQVMPSEPHNLTSNKTVAVTTRLVSYRSTVNLTDQQ